MTELVVSQGTLALRGDQIDWSPAQKAALAQIGIADAPPGDQQVFLHVAQRSGLDPFARQIYMIARWDQQSQKNKYTIQTAIDGYRVIAERRKEYGGQLEPQWCGEDGIWHNVWISKAPPIAARVAVIRTDWEHPVWGVAHFWEFAATKANGDLNHMWATKGRHQIAKCAEAAALRKAFPQDFSGLYTEEEMEHLDNPAPRVVIPSERAPAAEPDWDAQIKAAEDTNSREDLMKVWSLARGMRPNDGALLNRIAQAGERIKAAAAKATEPATPAPAEEAQQPEPAAGEPAKPAEEPAAKNPARNRLYALLRDGGVTGTDRAQRLRIVNRILTIENRTAGIGSFDQLDADDYRAVNQFLQDHKDIGDLVHTLAELGAEHAAD